MLRSMTAFAATRGTFDGFEWAMDVRSVNSKGLDLKIRVPDWVTGLEAEVRKRITANTKRGSLSFNLRLTRIEKSDGLKVSDHALDSLLSQARAVEQAAQAKSVTLSPLTVAEVFRLSSNPETLSPPNEIAALKAQILTHVEHMLTDFGEMRAQEGAKIGLGLSRQLSEIKAQTDTAEAVLPARGEAFKAALERAVTAISDQPVDPLRLEQEMAMIAVKSNVIEEVDRLRFHITAGQDLLKQAGPIGRKFDFLCQEFNREVNTLCSKSNMTQLTEIGLNLKVLVDQMREQVQNLE